MFAKETKDEKYHNDEFRSVNFKRDIEFRFMEMIINRIIMRERLKQKSQRIYSRNCSAKSD